MNRFKDAIVFIDSGIGGLSYFQYIKEIFPNNNYVYVADNKSFPYGEKTSKFILDSVLLLILKIKSKYKISALIFACNTASVSLYNVINFDFPVIYTLPEIGFIDNLHLKNVILIGTETTISSSFIKKSEKYL